MRKLPGIPRLLFTVILAGGPLSAAGSPEISSLRPAAPARVTIRGTGSAISVDRTAPPEGPAVSDTPESALDEAIRMKSSGTSDDALVWFLRAHRDELPAIVDLGTVSALRDAGAGRAVVAYLSSVAAVEIGPTGAEGRSEAPEEYVGPDAEGMMTNELPADLAWGGWGWGGTPNGGFGRGRGRSHGHAPEHGFVNRPGHGRGIGHGPAGIVPRPMPQRQSHPSQPSVRAPFRPR